MASGLKVTLALEEAPNQAMSWGTVVLVYTQLLYFPPFILLSIRAAASVNFSRPLHFSVLSQAAIHIIDYF